MEVLADYTEIACSGYSHATGLVGTYSAIDRPFTNLSVVDLMDFAARATLEGKLVIGKRLSDHMPLALVIECPVDKNSSAPARVPEWNADHSASTEFLRNSTPSNALTTGWQISLHVHQD